MPWQRANGVEIRRIFISIGALCLDIISRAKTAFENKEYDKKYEKRKWDYLLFPLDFLASVFAATGAVFEAGATAFLSLFDVVITSFSVFFVHCGFFHRRSTPPPAGIVELSSGF